VALWACACVTSPPPSGRFDDSGSSSVGTSDAGPAQGVDALTTLDDSPFTDGATTPFCADLDMYAARCGLTAQCRSDLAGQCPSSFDSHYGTAFKAALQACVASVSCTGLDAANDPCLYTKVVAGPVTATQFTVATDFCAACAQDARTTTANGISCVGHVIQLPQGYGRVMGVEVMSLSDTAAGQAEACIGPAQAAYPSDYNNCENSFLNCVAGMIQSPASCH
jgi:hypothetical protein